jgi:hypothetical protein
MLEEVVERTRKNRGMLPRNTPLLFATKSENGEAFAVKSSLRLGAHSTVQIDPGTNPSALSTPFAPNETDISEPITETHSAQHPNTKLQTDFFILSLVFEFIIYFENYQIIADHISA